MKLTKEKIKKLLNLNNIKMNYSFKCDLCGCYFNPIHKSPTMKANCPNCGHNVYTNAFDN